ncbi:Alpha/beta hydrolase family protein [Enhygromyxa salina]|uniref:Alpha/beta hydrolase family protein n=1 Tax=Enhygromyxa salina TaxID=215803 RepID=A0A2S9XYY8_9BACT|nr:alpha/beta fold hydrolase [Enhygromyxa salina]PRP98078.1 Alpha/beta hydrolase family protein [Enhygromyxa salina]
MTDFEALPSPVLHSVAALDGWLLRVWDFSPAPIREGREGRDGPGIEERRTVGVIVAGHAMMADSRTLCRPERATIVSVLVAAGFRVLVPDLRGHGESGPPASRGGDWNMDDLVGDVGHYVDLARSLEPELPVMLLGHSVFAHAALAWLGQNPDPSVRALVAMSCAIWNRRFEPLRWRWWLKRLLIWPTVLITELVGYMPARLLRLGSADEARSFWRQFHGFMRRDRWDSKDGKIDYFANLEHIRAPVLHVMSEGDRLYAPPTTCARLSAPINHRELLVLGRDDAPGDLARLRPDHMGMVTSAKSKLAWHWVAGWLRRKLGVAD